MSIMSIIGAIGGGIKALGGWKAVGVVVLVLGCGYAIYSLGVQSEKNEWLEEKAKQKEKVQEALKEKEEIRRETNRLIQDIYRREPNLGTHYTERMLNSLFKGDSERPKAPQDGTD